jgi:short-subunit dehydrogenase
VSVAAIRPHKPFWDISIEEWHRVFEVNLHSTFYLAKALAPSMMKNGKGGSIVALGGMASLTGQPIRSHVVASKTGLYGLIKSLALELGPYNVRANLIAVGFIDTKRINPEWYATEENNIPYNAADLETTPLRRPGTPQEVANVASNCAASRWPAKAAKTPTTAVIAERNKVPFAAIACLLEFGSIVGARHYPVWNAAWASRYSPVLRSIRRRTPSLRCETPRTCSNRAFSTYRYAATLICAAT